METFFFENASMDENRMLKAPGPEQYLWWICSMEVRPANSTENERNQSGGLLRQYVVTVEC